MGRRLLSQNLKEGNDFGDLSLDEGKILKYVLERKCAGDTNLVDLAQDMDEWRGPVNTMKKLRVP
jgi:hypothetical protein